MPYRFLRSAKGQTPEPVFKLDAIGNANRFWTLKFKSAEWRTDILLSTIAQQTTKSTPLTCIVSHFA